MPGTALSVIMARPPRAVVLEPHRGNGYGTPLGEVREVLPCSSAPPGSSGKSRDADPYGK